RSQARQGFTPPARQLTFDGHRRWRLLAALVDPSHPIPDSLLPTPEAPRGTPANHFFWCIRHDYRHPTMLIDTHAHLDDPRLSADLDVVIARAREEGVVQIVAVGTTAADSERVCGLARTRPGIFATVGIHPNHAAEAEPG